MNLWYVKPGGKDTSDGTSWNNAWATLAHASINVPADNGDIVRIGEGTYRIDWFFMPNARTNWVGGYYDGSWHGWTEGCGHDRPEIDSSADIANNDVSFENLDITSVLYLTFGYYSTQHQFTNCRFTGKIYVQESIVTFTNTDNIFNDPTGTPLPTRVTPVYHELVMQPPGPMYNTLTPRVAKITPDADIEVLITSWQTSGDQNKELKVTATDDRTITFQLGDMLPDTEYNLLVDGANVSSAVSDASGIITFLAYSGTFGGYGTFSEKVFEIRVSSGSVPRVMIF